MNIRPRPGEVDQPAPDMGRTESDEENSFLTDAEKQVDRLPQPYRTIDKIVMKIFNQTWEEIEAREAERIERAKRQQCDCVYANDPIESLSECSSICFSPDSRYIFASMFSGELHIFTADRNEFVCKLQADDMDPSCLDSMQCVSMKTGVYLLACIDDMGFAKLYIYADSKIYLVQNLNPQAQGAPKSNAEKFTLDSDGEFAGLASRMDDRCWVTFYKLPKDTWLSELSAATTAPESKSQRPVSGRSDRSMTAGFSLEGDKAHPSARQRAAAVVSFTPTSIIHKVNEPSKVEGNHYLTYKEALEHATCSFGIGSGEAHLFTDTHLKLRRAAIRKRHSEQMKHLDTDARPVVEYSPHWHFLRAAKLQPRSSATQEGTVSALVWWTNTYDAQMYPLQRGSVSNREGIPGVEVVWPMCDLITSSAVSSCTVNVALGMNNGTISVINRSECFPLTALSVRANVAINKISFLTSMDDTHLLASMADGGVSLVSCSTQTCKDLTPKLGHSDFELQLLCTLPPNGATKHFVCASSLDRLQIFDIGGDIAPLCDLVFSDSLEEAQDRFWCCPDGSRIYAKNDDATISSIQLDNLEVLSQVFQPCDTPLVEEEESFKDRMQNLLLQRTAEQPVRTLAFRERWFEMARELQTAS